MFERVTNIPVLPQRPGDGHKGTFGRVAVFGGSDSDNPRMLGAPALAAEGAVRSGCGLVRICTPEGITDTVLAMAPFATGVALPTDDASVWAERFDAATLASDALVVGPGFGRSGPACAVVIRSILQEDAPVVLDADALNILCDTSEFWRDFRASAVLTPHPGEARRLMDALQIGGDPAGDDDARINACAAIASRLGCVVVLKGAGTVVSDGIRVWVCERGHPCMATGGTGDVLAGVIGGLIGGLPAQDSLDLFACAQIGVQAHAIAGEAWAQQSGATGGMTPSELAGLVPQALESMR